MGTRARYEAMQKGEGGVVAGGKKKLQAATVTRQSVLADQHRKMAEPGSGDDETYQKPLG